ncbi:MAG: M48 family metallopeptidase [Muribaculaceae bacterium]|nr:M48 family metallopeptidase [Muribaculaceae bacterium]
MGRVKTVRMAPQSGELFRVAALGDTVVRLTRRDSTSRLSARWSGGKLHVIAPTGLPTSRFLAFLVAYADALLARRPGLRYAIGQTITLDGVTVTIASQSLAPTKVLMQGERCAPRVLVGTLIDLSKDESTALISRLMCVMARAVAEELLIPYARQVAARVGVTPRGWKISHGHHTLGRCSSRGEIALSELLVFLPVELKEYVICHELAHLSHFDHGEKFHRTCDAYLGGREKQLIRQLKHYNWPILRK